MAARVWEFVTDPKLPNDTFVQFYTLAIQFLCYYDYLLTFPDEVPFIPYNIYDFLTVSQIKYAWNGRKTWSEPIRPPHIIRADRTSLLDLHTRELVCIDPESFPDPFAEQIHPDCLPDLALWFACPSLLVHRDSPSGTPVGFFPRNHKVSLSFRV